MKRRHFSYNEMIKFTTNACEQIIAIYLYSKANFSIEKTKVESDKTRNVETIIIHISYCNISFEIFKCWMENSCGILNCTLAKNHAQFYILIHSSFKLIRNCIKQFGKFLEKDV